MLPNMTSRSPTGLGPTVLRLFWALVVAVTGASAVAAPLTQVRVSASGKGFVDGIGGRWVPFGVNYFRPGTGWAPQLWKQFDEAETRRDFELMRSMGVNCVRVFLTYGSFMQEAGVLDDEGLLKLDRFLELAEAAGIYVQPTGPDHWEGLPTWARGDRVADERVLTALQAFWRQLTARYRGRAVVMGYDLLNEPEVRWDSEPMREKWNRWLASEYGGVKNLELAWGREVDAAQWGQMPVPPKEERRGDARLLAYQRFRESVADEWTQRQVDAIKAGDPEALVTVGLIQWSVPTVLAGAFHYSGFRPERQAPMLDFLSVHFYPLADGAYRYQGREAEERNLAYLESVVREVAAPGKPVVLGEFGWYGGGRPQHVGGVNEPATEEQQAEWCERVVATSAGWAAGWLHWGFYDQPEARDVTELIGLVKADGTPKAWGRSFRELSGRLERLPAQRTVSRPELDWAACLTDGQARRDFLEAYVKAWRGDGRAWER